LRPLRLPLIESLDLRCLTTEQIEALFKEHAHPQGQKREIRYAVFPGNVTSENDGDKHYVGARQLMHLYGVDPRECIVISSEWQLMGREDYIKTLIPLWPHHSHYNYYVPGSSS
jgi:hypothetical protein